MTNQEIGDDISQAIHRMLADSENTAVRWLAHPKGREYLDDEQGHICEIISNLAYIINSLQREAA